MGIYGTHGDFTTELTARTIVVTGPDDADGRRFAGAARAADGNVHQLERIGDARIFAIDARVVTYARRSVRKVWRTRYGSALRVGMVLRFGNVTTELVAIDGRGGMLDYWEQATTRRRGHATTSTFRIGQRQPYRVLVSAETGESVKP